MAEDLAPGSGLRGGSEGKPGSGEPGRRRSLGRLPEGGTERYGLALVLILASLIFIMVAPDGAWSRVVAVALQSAALIASLRAADTGLRFRQFIFVLVVVSLAVSVIQAATQDEVNPGFVAGASLTLILVAAPLITVGLIRQVRAIRGATLHTMLGVLCIYLLICLAFAASFGLVEEIGGEPFFNQGAQWDTLRDYLYYSLTTITTFGIGDLTPASDAGRALTAAESLLGQIYLVTVVALIVSNLRPSKS